MACSKSVRSTKSGYLPDRQDQLDAGFTGRCVVKFPENLQLRLDMQVLAVNLGLRPFGTSEEEKSIDEALQVIAFLRQRSEKIFMFSAIGASKERGRSRPSGCLRAPQFVSNMQVRKQP
jgi:hypothetical protein